MAIWYILCSFDTLLPFLVSFTKKNLATLTCIVDQDVDPVLLVEPVRALAN
jgi:hypothetical protein